MVRAAAAGVIGLLLIPYGSGSTTLVRNPPSNSALLLVQPPGMTTQRVGDQSYPLVVVLHPNGSTPQAFKALLAEHLARRGRVVVALPQGPISVGSGFRWSSVEEAESLVQQAVDDAVTRVRVRGLILLGFADTATLACAIALRNGTNLIAVGPGLVEAAKPADPTNVRRTRFAVLCTQGESNATDCQATAALVKRLGFQIDFRMLTPERARAGMDRILEALAYVTYR